MAKVHVCDICLAEGKLTKTTRYFKVKHRPELRLDYCLGCRSRIPNDMVGYIKLVYSVVHKVELTDERAIELSKRRW